MILFTLEYIEDLFNLMLMTKGVEQEEQYHPEGDVYTHSFQALGHALRETIDTDLIFAAWLHDLGKAIVTERHERESVKLLNDIVSPKTLWLIEHHMRIRIWLDGTMKKLSKIKELSEAAFLPQLIHLRRIDASARIPNKTFDITPEELLAALNKTVEAHFEFNKAKAAIRRSINNAH
jgi:hypothetical protein